MIGRLTWCAMVLCVLPMSAQQRVVRGMMTDHDVAIRLWVPAGFVEVKGWDRDSVDVRVTPASGTSLAGGGSRSATKFALETDRGDSVLASGTMRVMVPGGARVAVKSTTATVAVQGVRGEVEVIQVSGNVTVLDSRGVVRVETIAGDIIMARIDGAIVVRGGSGRIEMTTTSGTLELSTVSGPVTLGERVGTGKAPQPLVANVETIGGEVRIIGRFDPRSRIGIATHDGAITITPSAGAMPRVESPMPGLVIPAEVRGGAGSGGVITVRTFKGTLNVAPPSGI